MRISEVKFGEFRPFAPLRIEFTPVNDKPENLAEVHFLVGENGTGKTRFLSYLCFALGNSFELSRRTQEQKVCGAVKFVAGNRSFWRCSDGQVSIEEIGEAEIRASVIGNGTDDNFEKLPWPDATISHPLGFAFQSISSKEEPTTVPFAPLPQLHSSAYLSFKRTPERDALVAGGLTNLVVQSGIDSVNGKKGNAQIQLQKLCQVVSDVTGRSLRFEVESAPSFQLVYNWGDLEMKFSQLPDGLRSILNWLSELLVAVQARQSAVGDATQQPLIIILDEPENHLHPAWQRHVIPAAQRLFPNGQFFVATHSPFVISSVNYGRIHLFSKPQNSEFVQIDSTHQCSRGDSWLDVVEDVLGINEWYDPETEGLLKRFRETKERALKGEIGQAERLRELSVQIGSRSNGLYQTMAKELKQFERLQQPNVTNAVG